MTFPMITAGPTDPSLPEEFIPEVMDLINQMRGLRERVAAATRQQAETTRTEALRARGLAAEDGEYDDDPVKRYVAGMADTIMPLPTSALVMNIDSFIYGLERTLMSLPGVTIKYGSFELKVRG